MKYTIWSNPETFEDRPEQIERILRSSAFKITAIDDYLEQIEKATGDDFTVLRSVARDSLPYQEAEAHLATRRLIAGFFSEKSISRWKDTLESEIAGALDHIAATRDPDLMRDFVNPLFLSLVSRVVGLNIDSVLGGQRDEIFAMIAQAQRLTEPMLSIRDLRLINSALIRLLGMLPDFDQAGTDMPGSLLDYLADKRDKAPGGTDLRNTALALLLAANTAAQSLGLALYGLLTGDADLWDDVAAADWKDDQLDKVLNLYPSTLTVVRVADETIDVGGCPYASNQAQVMDIVGANSALRAETDEGEARYRTLSFGTGAHKCPGEHLARLMIGAAIPALGRRFPKMMLHKDRAQFFQTPMIQTPVALPCELDGTSGRATARLWDIKTMQAARRIVNNDSDFSPPIMEPYLRELAQRSGRDLSQAIRISRNAMFFMSGSRHAAARRAMAESLGGNRIATWQGFIDEQVGLALEKLAQSPVPDLIHDFADPLFRAITRTVLGINVSDDVRFDALAPVLQDVLEPWLPMRELLRLQDVLDELLAMMDSPPARREGHQPSVFETLQAANLADFDAEDIKALVLVLYGASFNMAHTLGNILHWTLTRPPETRRDAAAPEWIASRLEGLISMCGSPKYIYRMARHPVEIEGFAISERDTTRLQLLSINRGVSHGHLSFGHGLHHCVGAALSRLMFRRAVPPLFARFPGLSLPPQRQAYFTMSQTVALKSLPCRLGADVTA